MPGYLADRSLRLRLLAGAGALVAAALAGCSSADMQGTVVSDPNVIPTNYRAEILAFLRTYLNDPTNIRSASISEPALRSTGQEERYGVCLRFNARKSNGEYEGVRERIVFFLSGRLDGMTEARRDQCAGATYQPFPELERLTR
ncbi:MAG TPA: hypothetical protein VHA55_02265 [Pseudorhodoplanes sp.]|jgi:hypothetical protein|nr:hypothetical protein [Pseudorhodoplanes sp.]